MKPQTKRKGIATATEGKRLPKICGDQMIGEFGNQRRVLRVPRNSKHHGPDKHVERGDERHIHQHPRPKWLWVEANFLQQPPAEILQRENVTAPAAHKTPEDQRRQNRQTKKDESRVDESALNCLHRLRRLDGRNRFAHDSPLDDVRDHEQVKRDQCRRAPPAGFGFANASFAVARDVLSAVGLAGWINSPLTQPLFTELASLRQTARGRQFSHLAEKRNWD